MIDTLIHARWVVPVEPANLVLADHSVAIHEGRIVEILPSDEARVRYEAEMIHELSRHVVIPGLINAHTHASMTLLRGLADDLPLMTWLNDHIWPAEKRWVSEEFVADGTRLAVAEMLRGGTTCFSDMYFFPDVTARISAAAGIRAVVGLIVIDFPSAWAADPDEYIHRGLEVRDHARHSPLIHTAFAPHAPYSVSDAPLQRVQVLADELQMPIHIHLHETADEVKMGMEGHGCRPFERLDRLGLISPNLVAVHMTQLEESEIERLAQAGAHVVTCPESNLKLASGFCPTAKLLRAGVNVAIGTDGAASNNDLDMFSEMRTTALLAKAVAGDPAALPAFTALRMATLNGAVALGIDGETGSLLPGKSADLVAVDLGAPETSPVYHPVSQLVYAAGRDRVSDVWVSGRQVLRSRELTTLDLRDIQLRACEWRLRIEESDAEMSLEQLTAKDAKCRVPATP